MCHTHDSVVVVPFRLSTCATDGDINHTVKYERLKTMQEGAIEDVGDIVYGFRSESQSCIVNLLIYGYKYTPESHEDLKVLIPTNDLLRMRLSWFLFIRGDGSGLVDPKPRQQRQ